MIPTLLRRAPAVRLKVLPRWPGKIVGTAPITVATNGAVATVSVDQTWLAANYIQSVSGTAGVLAAAANGAVTVTLDTGFLNARYAQLGAANTFTSANVFKANPTVSVDSAALVLDRPTGGTGTALGLNFTVAGSYVGGFYYDIPSGDYVLYTFPGGVLQGPFKVWNQSNLPKSTGFKSLAGTATKDASALNTSTVTVAQLAQVVKAILDALTATTPSLPTA